MKIQWLLIPVLMLGACRTPAGTKENKDVQKAAAAQAPEKLLQKIVGGKDGEKADQHFDCSVMSTDVPNVAQVKKWIAAVPKTTQTAYHIVATSPSLQLLAFEGTTPIIIHDDYSVLLTPVKGSKEADDAITELKSILDKKCPWPPQK